jgi:uncharacterized protein (TIGR02118 family)
MARLIAIYSMPKDKAAFDAYYFDSHVPLAKTLPGLQRYEVSTGLVAAPASTRGVHLVATLHFASMADLNAALASPAGKATARDLVKFADGGVDLLMMDDKTI